MINFKNFDYFDYYDYIKILSCFAEELIISFTKILVRIRNFQWRPDPQKSGSDRIRIQSTGEMYNYTSHLKGNPPTLL
jgi:hypothetical protein